MGHHPSVIMSVSYDMTAMVWDFMASPNPLLARYDQHTEFVVGCAFNLFVENLIATCSWDEKCCVFVNRGVPQQQQTMNNNIMQSSPQQPLLMNANNNKIG